MAGIAPSIRVGDALSPLSGLSTLPMEPTYCFIACGCFPFKCRVLDYACTTCLFPEDSLAITRQVVIRTAAVNIFKLMSRTAVVSYQKALFRVSGYLKEATST